MEDADGTCTFETGPVTKPERNASTSACVYCDERCGPHPIEDGVHCRLRIMKYDIMQRCGYVPSDDLLYALDTCEVDGVKGMLVRYAAQYGSPMVGSTRAVFDTSDGWVIKIPLNWDGICANELEADASGLAQCEEGGVIVDIPVALCHIVCEGDDQPILRMQRVEEVPEANRADLPLWTGWVDCAQVGYLPDGRLVAFDL